MLDWLRRFLAAEECKACKSKDDIVEWLKAELKAVREEKAAERAEFKRAIDSLIIELKGTPLGQGVAKAEKSLGNEMLHIFDEVKKVEEEFK